MNFKPSQKFASQNVNLGDEFCFVGISRHTAAMPHPNIRLLALPIAALCGLLLISLRLNAKWVGGTGKITPCPAQLVSSASPLATEITRGQSVVTTTGQTAIYQTCDKTNYVLDERTELRLTAYRHDQPTALNLIQGRVVVQGPADIQTRNVLIHANQGTCEIVHYSWRDEVDVTAHTPGACLVDAGPLFPVDTTIRLGTYDGEFLVEHPFDAQTSSASAFYSWAKEQGYF